MPNKQNMDSRNRRSTFFQSLDNLGCEFAELRPIPSIGFSHTSKHGNIGPYPESEEERVTTIKKAIFLKFNVWKEILFYLCCSLSVGIFWLLLYWYPLWCAKFRYDEVPSQDIDAEYIFLAAVDGQAEIVAIKNLKKSRENDTWTLEAVERPSFLAQCMSQSASSEQRPLLGSGSGKNEPLRLVVWRHVHLWYNPDTHSWHQVMFGPSRGNFNVLHEVGWKLSQTSDQNASFRQFMFGKNTVEVEVLSYPHILLLQMLTPFFVFQVYSVAIWLWEGQFFYTSVLIFMTLMTIMYTAWQIQKNQKALRILARTEGEVLQARFKSGAWSTVAIESSELTPGDVLLVTNGLVCPCDLVLLSGQCIANEAMLTGESAPVIKEPLPLEGKDFNPQTNKAIKHLLLCGSSILQAKPSSQPPANSKTEDALHSVWDLSPDSTPVLAMVLQTGCETAKGKLIQTIQYPQDTREFAHRQKEEAERFIVFLLVLTVIVCTWFWFYGEFYTNYPRDLRIVGLLDMTTILVPAGLPLILSVGVAFAFESLKSKSIFASSTNHIVTAGHVECVCYDKTGTLTTEGDTFVGVYSVQTTKEGSCFEPLTRTAQELPQNNLFRYILAGCHSLALMKREGKETSELIGEQLELEMFGASTWQYYEVPEQQTAGLPRLVKQFEVPPHCSAALLPLEELDPFLAVLRIFPFDAELRTMSTIVLEVERKQGLLQQNFVVKDSYRQFLLVKGAPEALKKRCTKQSLPHNFDNFLEGLTLDGYRILGCAYKELKGSLAQNQQLSRDALEKDLTFCGFLVMGNQLKPETRAVLNEVKNAGLRQCMVTGDNILTALSVAKSCEGIFLLSEPIYVLEYPGYVPYSFITIDQFTLEAVSARNSEGNQKHFKTFLELLQNIEDGQIDFSLAVSGDAFFALMDLHDDERPNEFGGPSKRNRVMSRSKSFDESMHAPSKASTGFGALPLENTPAQLVLSIANVFARFKPHEKQMLMSALQKLRGHYVCMVGDGANDSFALKTADIGLSISSNAQIDENLDANEKISAAPSIAAPFSTPISNISPVKDLLAEGRGALASTLIAFRFMIHYGLASIAQVIILYVNGMAVTGREWVVGDLFVNLSLALVINMTECSPILEPGVPEVSIMGSVFFLAFFGHFGIIILTQVVAILYLQAQPWYIHYSDIHVSMESTVSFWIQISQYITTAITLSHNYGGFRAHWWTNIHLVVVISVLSLLDVLIIVYNRLPFIQTLFTTVVIPESYCWELVGLLVGTCLLHMAFELSLPFKAKTHVSRLSVLQRKNTQMRLSFAKNTKSAGSPLSKEVESPV